MVYNAKSDDANTISQFTRRKTVTITTGGTSTPANYQSKLTISYESEMQADFDDIRFNTKSGSYIDYWIESYVASTSAVVWIELPDAITNPGSDTILMYYGNTGLGNESDGDDVFDFFDDFEGASIDAGKWTVSNFVTSADQAYHGSKSAKATTTGNITHDFVGINNIILEGYFYEHANTNNTAIQWWNDADGGRNIVGTRDATSATHYVWYKGGAWSTTSIGRTVGWHHVKANIISGTKAEVYLDGNDLGDDVTCQDLGVLTPQNWMPQSEYYDLIFIRKYIANEPTPSYGTSQHQRVTPQLM